MEILHKKSRYIKGLFYEDGVKCHLCLFTIDVSLSYFMEDNRVNPLALSEDHVIAKVNGGEDSLENIKPVHAYCNFVKGERSIEELDLNNLKKSIKEFINNSINKKNNSLRAYFTCLHCGELFTCEAARLSKYNKKYCNNNCKNSFLISNGSSFKNCCNCGELFKVTNSRINSGRGKYCSTFCYNSFGDKRKLQCRLCESFYYLSVNNNRSLPLTFCSSCRKNK